MRNGQEEGIMQPYQILVVEDDNSINELLCTILKKEGYQVTSAFSGTEAKLRLEQGEYDLLLLDLMLPGITGEELIDTLRKDKTIPVIVISAKTAMEDRIGVLKSGADDFISKPFDVGEVLARVQAQLRRYREFSAQEKEEHIILKYKDLVLDPETVTVTVAGNPVQLTAREFKILQLLMSYPKKVFTKENLFTHVWNEEFFGGDNTVNVHISNLRAKLAKYHEGEEYIKTVWGIGFKMAD